MSSRLRRLLTLLVAVMAGMAGESLILVRAQVGRFERLLRDDFQVIMFLRDEPTPGQEKILQEKLQALPEVQAALFIPRDEALATLRREDPELVDSITWIGENPLHSAFAVRPTPAGLKSFPQWLAAARGAADWADLRYRPGQARAILQAQLYGHFLSLLLSALLCSVALILTLALWRMSRPGLWAAVPAIAWSAVGAAAGMALALAAAWPARQYLPWWELPLVSRQLVTWAACACSAGLCSPWKVPDAQA